MSTSKHSGASFMNRLIGGYIHLVERLGDAILIATVRRGLMMMIPVVLIGSFALLFSSFPIPAYQAFMTHILGPAWQSLFTHIHQATTGIFSLLTAAFVSYALSEGQSTDTAVPVMTSCVTLCCFIALFGIDHDTMSVSNFGVLGVFPAIVTAIAAGSLFIRLSTIEALRIKPISSGDSATFGRAVSAILPAAITIFLFSLLGWASESVFHITDINASMAQSISGLFRHVHNDFFRALLFVFFIHFLWFFGIHGSNMLEPVTQSLYAPALAINQQLIAAGLAPTEIFSKTFFDTFVLMGGCGSAVCLVAAVFLLRQNRNQLRVARLSMVPLFFNINELIVFGFPIVLNPIYLIPFIFVPLILTLTSWASVTLGWVPHAGYSVEWTTPIFVSGFYATGSLRGSLLQLVNLVIGSLCYLPFVLLSETLSRSRQKRLFGELLDEYKRAEAGNRQPAFFSKRGASGNMATLLAEELKTALCDQTLALFYQPQVDYHGRVFCAEGLLRWNHPIFGYIYPPLAVALAEHYGFSDELGFYTLQEACKAVERLSKADMREVDISVNVTALQLKNESFCNGLFAILQVHRVAPSRLKLEITEKVALENDEKIRCALTCLADRGVAIEMDDFGMGHSSLMYLKEYRFSTIKLDGALVREILDNPSCREIIASIVYLSKSLEYHVLAEFVETPMQRDALYHLGCSRYQGYLYSPALPLDELISYIELSRTRSDALPS